MNSWQDLSPLHLLYSLRTLQVWPENAPAFRTVIVDGILHGLKSFIEGSVALIVSDVGSIHIQTVDEVVIEFSERTGQEFAF